VALADRLVDEAVEFAVDALEVHGFLGHQAGQVIQPSATRNQSVDSAAPSTPQRVTASIFSCS
jgi:hypothetical protein